MTAISGLCSLDGAPAEPDRLQRMARPPGGHVFDELDSWADDRVALACALTRIAPESQSERQPLRDPTSGIAVVFDGRLDNRTELLGPLAVDSTEPDVAFALAVYAEYGTDAVRQLRGDYALAVWDPRDGGRLLLACDPMGLKPLYYAVERGRLVFATTLEQVTAGLDERPEPDDQMTASYIYRPLLAWPGSCFLERVETVRGGELLEVRDGELSHGRYWHWPTEPPSSLEARGDEPDEFRAILEDAVRCRLRSSAPVGVYLSGGLDSGSVASVAGRLVGPGSSALRAYTIVYDRFAETDEREYAAAVVDAYALPQRLVSGDGGWTLAELEPWLPVFSDPMFGAFDTLNYHALPVARDDGVRVLLTGHGGDVLLLRSATYFASWLVHGHWRALARQLHRKRETGRLGYGYQFAAWALFPLLPARLQELVERRRFRLADLRPWMPEPILRRSREEAPKATPTGPDGWWRDVLDHVEAFCRTPQNLFLDRLYRHFGLEPRHPYLDVRMAEFALRAPPDVFFRDGRSRWVVSEALRDVLPPLVRDRTAKTEAAPLFHYGLRERRAPFVRRLLQDSEIVRRGYVLGEPWRASVERYLAGSDAEPIWNSLAAEIWLRHREGRLPPLES